jgi:hypothetical protein
MESKQTEVTILSVSASQRVYARVAGLAYVAVILLGVFGVALIESGILVQGDDAATVKNIIDNELQFRIGVASEIVMYALVILLSVSLYVVLKTVNKNLALLALLWRLGEAIIGGSMAVLSGLVPLLLLDRSPVIEAELLQTLIGLFLGVRGAGLDVVLIFIGVGGTVFCYLFFRSNYVPRILAAWGMFTYMSMLILSITSILIQEIPEHIRMVFYAPGGLFELIFGMWLLLRGLNADQ